MRGFGRLQHPSIVELFSSTYLECYCDSWILQLHSLPGVPYLLNGSLRCISWDNTLIILLFFTQTSNSSAGKKNKKCKQAPKIILTTFCVNKLSVMLMHAEVWKLFLYNLSLLQGTSVFYKKMSVLQKPSVLDSSRTHPFGPVAQCSTWWVIKTKQKHKTVEELDHHCVHLLRTCEETKSRPGANGNN